MEGKLDADIALQEAMDVTPFRWDGLVDAVQNACDVAGFLPPRIPSSPSVFPTSHATRRVYQEDSHSK